MSGATGPACAVSLDQAVQCVRHAMTSVPLTADSGVGQVVLNARAAGVRAVARRLAGELSVSVAAFGELCDLEGL